MYKYALITGATRGLGYSFAKALAGLGCDLLLVARTAVELDRVKKEIEGNFGVNVQCFSCDLSSNESVYLLLDYINSQQTFPDLIINNAAGGIYGAHSATDLEKELEIINLNIIAPILITKSYLNKKYTGKINILNISSTIANRKSPNWAVYAATKAFIQSYTKSLTLESKGSSIEFSLLIPGKTDTGFDLASGAPIDRNRSKASPDFVVSYCIEQLQKGKKVIIPGMKNKIIITAYKLLPDFLIDLILRKL